MRTRVKGKTGTDVLLSLVITSEFFNGGEFWRLYAKLVLGLLRVVDHKDKKAVNCSLRALIEHGKVRCCRPHNAGTIAGKNGIYEIIDPKILGSK